MRAYLHLRPALAWGLGLAALVTAAACASSVQARNPELLYNAPLVTGPLSPSGVQAILGTSDLGVGANRVGFVLQTDRELVTVPEATVTSLYYPGKDSEGEPKETVTATFQPWPYGTRGMYTARFSFDRAGLWGLDIRVEDSELSQLQAQISFAVKERADTPAVGEQAPRSENKTVGDVGSLEELTTGSLIDPDLYRMTIAEAVESGQPTVAVLTSPAYCTNAVCGPQDEVLAALKEAYKGQANFIHVDVFDNPTEIRGDLARARLSSVVEEWNLPSIEWTFVLDPEGVIAAKFEAFATFEELEEALLKVLS